MVIWIGVCEETKQWSAEAVMDLGLLRLCPGSWKLYDVSTRPITELGIK